MATTFATQDEIKVTATRSKPRTVVEQTAILLTGAGFGLFFAWICTTMWGLDDADPRVAIEAMQAMNASVRNAVFFPAFFLSPIVLFAAGLMNHRSGSAAAGKLFFAAAGVFLVGTVILTMAVNVPMNEDLANTVVPTDVSAAEKIWSDYSPTWQLWNVARTVFAGIALMLAASGIRRSAERG